MKTITLTMLVAVLWLAGVFPVQARTDLPLPRFVTVRATEANVRTGPGLRYPIKWVYVRKNMPVEVIAEFEQWRKVRDIQGDEGWIHRSMLTNKRTAVVAGETQIMKEKPSLSAHPVARVELGVNVHLLSCNDEFCYIRAGDEQVNGWVLRNNLWGLYPREEID